MDMQKLAFALQGLGAGLQGQNTAPYVQGAQALSEERKKAMAQDARTMLEHIKAGRPDKAVKVADNRIELIDKFKGDSSDTREWREWMLGGQSEKAIQDLEATVQMAQRTGLLEGAERIGTMGGQVIERAPDGSYRAVTPDGYDPGLAGGDAKYGLTPTFVEGPNGLEVVQLSSQGGARTVDLPEGYRAVDPYQKALMTGRGSGDAKIQTEQRMTPVLADQAAATTTATNRAQAQTVGDVEAAKIKGRTKAETEAARPEAEAKRDLTQRYTDNVLETIDTIKTQAGYNTTGAAGKAMAMFPGTEAFDLSQNIKTLQANLGFDRLQQMRENSPTGGALGSVAIQELEALQASIAAASQAQSKGQFLRNLQKIEKHYKNVLNIQERAFGKKYGADAPAVDDLVNQYAD